MWRGAAIASTAVALALAAAPAAANASIDLAGAPGVVRADGQAANDFAGFSVADAGDVNGDGKPDLIIGAFSAGNNGAKSGSAYVIYGGQSLHSLDLGNLGASGFRIDGPAASYQVGVWVAGAGDVNGDGIADVIVGANGASDNGRMFSGAAYVIYGQRTADPADVNLANITTSQASRGMVIDGAAPNDFAGTSVAGAGDFNGDGKPDVIVGATGAIHNGFANSGTAYVVYGQTAADPPDVDLASLGARGMEIDGSAPASQVGSSVDGAGDVNGDGRADVIVGVDGANEADVIYGQSGADPTDVDLAQLTTTQANRGMRILGAAGGDTAGFSVAGGGDLNGDGRPDVLVGAPLASNNSRTHSGSAYIVYGQHAADPPDVDLGALGARGFRIDGASEDDEAGISVAGGGDVNGDGHPDAVVGAPGVSNNSRASAGAAYVVNGQQAADPADLDLGALGARGTEIDGAASDDNAGSSVADGADVNGDGHPDVILSAIGADNNSRSASGSTYVVDLARPDTSIDSGPGLTNDRRPTFSFHATEPATFRCSIDVGTAGFLPCSGPGGTHTPPIGLVDGTYTFRVAATDRSGNVDPTPATRRFTIDTRPPQTRIAKHPKRRLRLKGHKRRAKAKFKLKSSEPGSKFTCRIDHKRPKRCKSPTSYRLKKGDHTFSVAATDAAGNADASAAKFKFEVVKAGRHGHHR